MPEDRIYSAPSLSVVIKHLLDHRLTGLLTFWRVSDSYNEEVKINVQFGRPQYIRHGQFTEPSNGPLLTTFNAWGIIHFTFQPTQPILQLPQPESANRSRQTLDRTTGPLKALRIVREHTEPYKHTEDLRLSEPGTESFENETATEDASSTPAPTIIPEKAIPILTTTGQKFPVAELPRYDRTVFLLINGRRTVADLIHLTRRSLPEVSATLERLQTSQLIIIHKQTTS